MGRLPDFIIIGAMKSATSTLQEQLVLQPGIFMSSPKEPNFFSDVDVFSNGLNWYTSLFENAKPGDLLGEASTHYTKLPTYPETIKRLKESLPELRLIYVMRHPIDRLISHYIHEWSMGVFHCDINEAVEKYPELMTYGLYSYQLADYFKAYGKENILPVFFDRLVSSPQEELERVCAFIGYHQKPIWHFDLAASNVSSQRIRRFPFYNLIVESNIATYLRRKLIPQSFRDKVKKNLTMQSRPQLNEINLLNLTNAFDDDVKKLGDLLGIELNCDNFKENTRSNALNWV